MVAGHAHRVSSAAPAAEAWLRIYAGLGVQISRSCGPNAFFFPSWGPTQPLLQAECKPLNCSLEVEVSLSHPVVWLPPLELEPEKVCLQSSQTK